MISIPFGLTDEMVKISFLDAIASMPKAPLDAAAKAKIVKIEKIYTLCRIYDFDFQADWSATSIWEHKENYTEYTTEMVFVDEFGNESKYKLSDKYKGPVPKTVPVTKSKTVRDNVEQTYGSVIGSTTEFKVSATANTLSWVSNLFSKNEILNEAKETEDKTAVKWEAILELEARKQALQSEEIEIHNRCAEEVPGNYYNDLRVNLIENNYELTEVWLPLIMVTFEYEDTEYHLLLKGSAPTVVSDMYFLSYPTDQAIVNGDNQYENQISSSKSKKTKSLVISIFLFILSFYFSSTGSGIINTIVFIAFLVGGGFFLYKFFSHKKILKSIDQKQNDIATERNAIRTSIAETMKRTDVSEEEKQKLIESLLKK